jgi:hypothetical protein
MNSVVTYLGNSIDVGVAEQSCIAHFTDTKKCIGGKAKKQICDMSTMAVVVVMVLISWPALDSA